MVLYYIDNGSEESQDLIAPPQSSHPFLEMIILDIIRQSKSLHNYAYESVSLYAFRCVLLVIGVSASLFLFFD